MTYRGVGEYLGGARRCRYQNVARFTRHLVYHKAKKSKTKSEAGIEFWGRAVLSQGANYSGSVATTGNRATSNRSNCLAQEVTHENHAVYRPFEFVCSPSVGSAMGSARTNR